MVEYILTPTQMDAVKSKGEHMLVKGVPGSGKTTVLMMKLQNIIEADPKASILFVTFNNTLQKYIKESLKGEMEQYMGVDLDGLDVEVNTYQKWVMKVLRTLGLYREPADRTMFEGFIDVISGTHRFRSEKEYRPFVEEEIQWIKNKGLDSYAEYKDIQRTGRGTALQVKDRKAVYDILEEWEEYLDRVRRYSWQDYPNVLDANIVKASKRYSYDYIFIDEAQDLSQIQLITLRKLSRKGLIVAADLGQKIYKTDFTWVSVGIKVQGVRTKKLDGAFRSTKEIMDLANSLLKHDSTLDAEDIEQEYVAETSGLKPGVLNADGYEYEIQLVAELVKDIQAQAREDVWEPSIGILHLENRRLDGWRRSFYHNGIQSEIIREQQGSALTPGVKLLTMHGAKGLEFDYVIVCGLSKNYPPHRHIRDDEKENAIDTYRRLLYVSMTRAKENVYFTYKGEPSRYIGELDENMYVFEEY